MISITNKIKKVIFFILPLILVFISTNFIFAQEKLEVNFFYSEKCPHCAAEQKFLDEIQSKYPQVKINRYSIEDSKNIDLLKEFCKECQVDQYFGLVPMTFIKGDFILGFDNKDGIGKKIEETILKYLNSSSLKENQINLPFLKNIDLSKYSLPVLTIILGLLDGINVCSLGAITLILGLVIALRSKVKTLIFGGFYLFITALIYGFSIFAWYKIFSIFAPYIKIMRIFIGVLSLGGGIYFIREFLRLRKEGLVCEIEKKTSIPSKFSQKVKDSFKNSKSIFAILGSILLFTAVITIVEYPCSAVVPVVFAGVLSQAQISELLYLFYIALYLLFYLLDEIIIFLISVFTMKLWVTSSKLVTKLTLGAAILFFLFGIYYIFG